jgi:hypothetical protein
VTIRFVCDDPDRILARIFRTMRSGCECCSFWRGVLFGAACSAIGTGVGYLIAPWLFH